MDWLTVTGIVLKLMNLIIFNQSYKLDFNSPGTLPLTIQTTDSLMYVESMQDADSSLMVKLFISPPQDLYYQPKTTSDVASDYMPEIIPDLALLPVVAQENFS